MTLKTKIKFRKLITKGSELHKSQKIMTLKFCKYKSMERFLK